VCKYILQFSSDNNDKNQINPGFYCVNLSYHVVNTAGSLNGKSCVGLMVVLVVLEGNKDKRSPHVCECHFDLYV